MATEKSQNREWPFAGLSGFAARTVVKQAKRDVLAAACERTSRARSHAALCVWRRRLPPRSSRRELQGARQRLACRRPRRPRRRDSHALHALRAAPCPLTCALRPWPSQAADGSFTHAATGSWGGDWKVANSKVAFCHSFGSSCALYCFACSGGDVVCCARVCRTVCATSRRCMCGQCVVFSRYQHP